MMLTVRPLDEQPTIHEGVTARIIEQKGGTSERCEINRQIKADNKLLRELKKQYAKLVEAVKHTVASVSKIFKILLKNMICYRYNIEAPNFWKFAKQVEVSALKSKSNKHLELYTELKEKFAERKKRKAELDKIPKLQIFKRSELMGKINTLSEQIEDLYAEHSSIIHKLKAYRKQQQEQTYPKPKQHSHVDEE